jgi:hypothetical protein
MSVGFDEKKRENSISTRRLSLVGSSSLEFKLALKKPRCVSALAIAIILSLVSTLESAELKADPKVRFDVFSGYEILELFSGLQAATPCLMDIGEGGGLGKTSRVK